MKKPAVVSSFTYTFITSTGAQTSGGGAVGTGPVNTTTANLIVVHVCGENSPGALTDTLGNTWTLARTDTGSFSSTVETLKTYYCINPTVGTAQKFNVGAGASSFPAIFVSAYRKSVGSPALDQQNGNHSNTVATTTVQPNNVTPSSPNELIVTGLFLDFATSTGTNSIGSGFSLLSSFGVTGSSVGGAQAYIIQTSALAENPVWSTTVGSFMMASILTFN